MTENRGASCEISIVVPAFNEAESLPDLLDQLEEVLVGMQRSYEIWVVDDGSNDGTLNVLTAQAGNRPHLHALSLSRNYGKAVALSAGFNVASGDVVIPMIDSPQLRNIFDSALVEKRGPSMVIKEPP